jgi:hypothetical protein
MKNLKQLLATGTMMTALMVGTTFAGTGLLVSDFADNDPCSEESSATGLLVSDFAGLLVSDFAGLLVSDYTAAADFQPLSAELPEDIQCLQSCFLCRN